MTDTEQDMLLLRAEVETLKRDRDQWRRVAEESRDYIQPKLREENAQLKKENSTLRNELCLKCGGYHTAHEGSCDGCGWRKET